MERQLRRLLINPRRLGLAMVGLRLRLRLRRFLLLMTSQHQSGARMKTRMTTSPKPVVLVAEDVAEEALTK